MSPTGVGGVNVRCSVKLGAWLAPTVMVAGVVSHQMPLEGAGEAPGGPVTVPAIHHTPTLREYARGVLRASRQAGEWRCLEALWERESHWNPRAQNKHSTAYGVAQFLDSTWKLVGHEKTPDGRKQVLAGLAYIRLVYHDSPCAAYRHAVKFGWY